MTFKPKNEKIGHEKSLFFKLIDDENAFNGENMELLLGRKKHTLFSGLSPEKS